jgi:hypothetical protein
MIKLGRQKTLTHTFYDEDAVLDAGSVTVTVKNSAGTTVLTGSATKTGAGTSAQYSIVLPAQTELGKLTVDWAGSVTDRTYTEIVGNYLFEGYELDLALQAKGLKKTYSADVKAQARDLVTDTFDAITNTSFVPRRRQAVLEVFNGQAFTPTVGVSQVVTVDSAAFTGTHTWNGCLSGLTGSSATVVYDYCYFTDGIPTQDVRQAAIDLAVFMLGAQTRSTPDQAETITTGDSTYRLIVPGTRGFETGIPSIDAVLKRYQFNTELGVA